MQEAWAEDSGLEQHECWCVSGVGAPGEAGESARAPASPRPIEEHAIAEAGHSLTGNVLVLVPVPGVLGYAQGGEVL